MEHRDQNYFYYIKMAGKIANLNLVQHATLFLVIKTFILTDVVDIPQKIVFETPQIQISYFSRHFYEVNVILISVLHFWTNFNEKKLCIFYDPFFNVMTISVRPEVVEI